jgi:hypothetical protein
MKDRVDKSMGRATLIVEVLGDIKPTEPLRFAKRGARKKRNCSDSSGNSPAKNFGRIFRRRVFAMS